MKHLLFFLFLIISLQVNAQEKTHATLTGFVYDKETGEALIGATVLIDGTTTGASTNHSGFFSIPGVRDERVSLVVRYFGYIAQTIPLKVNFNTPNQKIIYLVPDAIEFEEIVVTGKKTGTAQEMFEEPVSNVKLTGQAIRKLPQLLESDLMRSLQTLPGVVPLSDYSSQLYIRGGTPDQNLYLVDGADVYNPEHAFGLFSTFNTESIKNVTLSKGGFGAKYGGRLSSVLDITNLDGNRYKTTGTSTVSLLAAKATIQTPLGSWGSLSGSFRRTYLDLIRATSESLKEDIPDYYFYDGTLKLFADINSNNKLTLSFFSSRDDLRYRFNEKSDDSDGINYNWGNRTFSLKWTTLFNASIFADFWITTSRFDSDLKTLQITEVDKNKMSDISMKANLEWLVSPKWDLLFGIEQKFIKPDYSYEFDGGLVHVQGNRSHQSAYSQATYRPHNRWVLEAGLRIDRFLSDANFTEISPRYAIKYKLDDTQNLKLAGGIYRQYLHRVPRFFVGDIWVSTDKNIKPSKSIHTIASYEKWLDAGFSFQTELFYKTYTNLNSFNQFIATDLESDGVDDEGRTLYTNTRNLFDVGNGNSKGFELMLKKDGGIVTGWAAYTYSVTKWEVEGINQNNEYNPRHDRTHVANLVLNTELDKLWDLLWKGNVQKRKNRWLMSLNFVYSSGQPITTPNSVYLSGGTPDAGNDGVTGDGGNISFSLYPSDINSARLPAYIRTDISVTRELTYEKFTLSPYVQIFNLFNRKNIWFVTYEDDSKETDRIKPKYEKVTMFPLLPTIGVTITF